MNTDDPQNGGGHLPADFDAAIADYYARRAPSYDDIYLRPERQRDLAAIKRKLSQSLKARRVLDVACGTGYLTQSFAANALETVGIDVATPTLDLARHRALPNTRFLQGDAYALDAALGLFDAAFLGFFWSHIPRQRISALLDGLGRHLSPGARVILLDNCHVPGNSTPVADTDADGNGWQTRMQADGTSARVMKNYPSYASLLAQCGSSAHSTHWWMLEYYWWFEFETSKT